MIDWDDYIDDEGPPAPPDPAQIEVRKKVEELFTKNSDKIYFSRQIEIMFEKDYFHWITNRAIRNMVEEEVIYSEEKKLKTGGDIHILWNKRNRYYKRESKKLIKLVDEYADPSIGAAIGLYGELMVLEGFARYEFLMKGRDVKEYKDKTWRATGHDMDFIFEKDNIAYGVEVKNTLGYMSHKELVGKIKMCKYLGLRPVFVARMLPRTWIHEINVAGGFGLILKYQLYPISHKELARKVSKVLGLPVDTPRMLADGTMERFMKWHRRLMRI